MSSSRHVLRRSSSASRGVTDIAGFFMFRTSNDHKTIEYLLLKKPVKPHKPVKTGGAASSWSPPKGHVEHVLEEPLDAARRETQEETGLLPNQYQVYLDLHEYFEYEAMDGVKKCVNIWPARLSSWDDPVTLSHEHIEYQWVADNNCLNFVREQYQPAFVRIMENVHNHFNTF